MARYNSGDYVKFELAKTACDQSEWLWMIVDFSDDEAGMIFGKLDSIPVGSTQLRVGQYIAVSFDNIRDVLHR
jgi:hypothetical protein